MTPEERAQAIIDMTRQWWTDNNLVEMISNSIRAAENDALERAAIWLDGLDEMIWPGNLAFEVRQRKHKDLETK